MMTRLGLRVVLTIGIACLALRLSWALLLYVTGLYEVSSKPADFAPVVADLMSGRLRPDSHGNVVLPRRYSSLTRGGQANYLRKNNGLVLILFPTWRGKGPDLRGYLYHNKPLSKADILSRWGDRWAVAVPHRPVMPSNYVNIDREVGSHWYYVDQMEHG
jgi:hypothetical protein